MVAAMYVDDLLILGSEAEEAGKAYGVAREVLKEVGLRINESKAMREPVRTVTYLGYQRDLRRKEMF